MGTLRHTLSRLRNSNTVSARIFKVMRLFSGVQGLLIFCGLLRSKLIALWIGPAGIGLYAVFNAALQALMPITQLNIRQSAVRSIAAARESDRPAIVASVRWWLLRLGIIGAVVTLLLAPALSWFSFGKLDMWPGFAVLAVAVFCYAVANADETAMQGYMHLRPIFKVQARTAIISIVVGLLIIYFFREDGIVWSIVIYYAIFLFVMLRYCDIPRRRFPAADNRRKGREFVRLGFYLTIAGFLGTFVQYAMISYLTKYHGEATAGIYQSGFLIICSYAGLLFNAISLEYFPRLSQIASRPKMASVAVSHEIAIAMYVLVPVVIVFLAADRLILRLLFSSEFMVALPMITVGITMLIFRGISFCLAIVILARGEGRTYIITESLSSVIGLALNISFFHYWGYLGVAVSFIIWYFIYCIITGVVYYRNFGMRLTPGVIRLIVFSIVVTAAALALRLVAWWLPLLLLPLSMWVSVSRLRVMVLRKGKEGGV